VSGWVWLAVSAVGSVGACLRYVVDGSIAARRDGRFPVGTLTINLTGSFVLGVITGLALYHAFPETPKVVMGAGFLGAYTTFSTFAFETVTLANEGERRAAIANVFVTVLGGCVAAAAGLALASV
jgi:CrcB protein